MSGSNRSKGDGDTIAAVALDLLDSGKPSFGDGVDMCWSYTDGPLTVTATMRTGARAMNAVVAVDDHDDRLETLDGRAWKEWLRLSNWFGLGGNHRITTRTLLELDTSAPVEAPTSATLSPEWQDLFDSTVSDAEKELVVALAETGVPVPELSYETDDGDVVDFAWGERRIGVLLEPNDEVTRTMSESGWTLCPPDAEQIAAALQSGTA